MSTSHDKKIFVARPRGFCAGVDRAIDVVELALEVYGPPIYVKHAIVHNTHVVKRLEKKGAHFTDDIASIPKGSHVVFSAHGSPPEHFALAREKDLHIIDATCPLVTKVHLEVARFSREGYAIIMVGHRGHVEPIGTLGNADISRPQWLIETPDEAAALDVPKGTKLAVVTQTTLSLDETKETLAVLRARFPDAVFPSKEDICYATTNRQTAVKHMMPMIDVLFVLGSATSSNSNRLREVGERAGVPSYLLDDISQMSPEMYKAKNSIGITSGASVPEDVVQETVRYFFDRGFTEHVADAHTEEDVFFALPHDFVKEISTTDKGKSIVAKHSIQRGRTMKI